MYHRSNWTHNVTCNTFEMLKNYRIPLLNSRLLSLSLNVCPVLTHSTQDRVEVPVSNSHCQGQRTNSAQSPDNLPHYLVAWTFVHSNIAGVNASNCPVVTCATPTESKQDETIGQTPSMRRRVTRVLCCLVTAHWLGLLVAGSSVTFHRPNPVGMLWRWAEGEGTGRDR